MEKSTLSLCNKENLYLTAGSSFRQTHRPASALLTNAGCLIVASASSSGNSGSPACDCLPPFLCWRSLCLYCKGSKPSRVSCSLLAAPGFLLGSGSRGWRVRTECNTVGGDGTGRSNERLTATAEGSREIRRGAWRRHHLRDLMDTMKHSIPEEQSTHSVQDSTGILQDGA